MVVMVVAVPCVVEVIPKLKTHAGLPAVVPVAVGTVAEMALEVSVGMGAEMALEVTVGTAEVEPEVKAEVAAEAVASELRTVAAAGLGVVAAAGVDRVLGLQTKGERVVECSPIFPGPGLVMWVYGPWPIVGDVPAGQASARRVTLFTLSKLNARAKLNDSAKTAEYERRLELPSWLEEAFKVAARAGRIDKLTSHSAIRKKANAAAGKGKAGKGKSGGPMKRKASPPPSHFPNQLRSGVSRGGEEPSADREEEGAEEIDMQFDDLQAAFILQRGNLRVPFASGPVR
ncbi:hypothetical protein CYMTET_48876 [Cymbomonas tetramitiformis]|uniref:Uncharacterized protein n=1 Tax=Cymbomonas tetramitiformis TaxID=36881 RepID=A0AAE0BSG4_9CHLO|nr:hypothetical protein CYMTET_48876 [Cymbomonas tetramitiformis]